MRHLLCLLLLLLHGAAWAQQPQQIAPDVWLLRGSYEAGKQPDGNSILLRGSEGWLLIDSGRHAAHTEALLKQSEGRLKAVINTHWHLDHLGGNALLRERVPGLQVYASAAVDTALQGWLARSREQMLAALKDEKLPSATRQMMQIDLDLLSKPQALAPDQRIREPGALLLAGRRLRVGLESAVSGGDLWVLDEASGTLMTGDLITWPVAFMDTACAEDWDAALGRLEALPFERIVPGHGPVMSRAELHKYRQAWQTLQACAASSAEPRACSMAWIEALPGLIATEERPRVHAMLAYYLKSRLRAAPAEARAFCAAAAEDKH